MTHRHDHKLRSRSRRYGILAVLGVLSGVVSVFGVTATYAGDGIAAERAIDSRAAGKPAALRHDPADPTFNIWGGADPADFVPDSWDLPVPGGRSAADATLCDFGLAVPFELIRDGASRAPPLA